MRSFSLRLLIMYYKSEFIVLKRINYADNDRIITLLSPEKGKITAIAKGSRKIASKLAPGIELFTHSSGYFAQGKNLDILTQVNIINPFLNLRNNFSIITKIFYLLELCYITVQQDQENKAIFDILLNTLTHIEKYPDLTTANITFFEMQLLSILGFRPHLYNCANCNQALDHKFNIFAIYDHGILCPICLEKNNYYTKINTKQLEKIQNLQNITFENYQNCLESFCNINHIPGIFLSGIIGKPIKTK